MLQSAVCTFYGVASVLNHKISTDYGQRCSCGQKNESETDHWTVHHRMEAQYIVVYDPNLVSVSATETWFLYWQPKPRSSFSIGFGAVTFCA